VWEESHHCHKVVENTVCVLWQNILSRFWNHYLSSLFWELCFLRCNFPLLGDFWFWWCQPFSEAGWAIFCYLNNTSVYTWATRVAQL
jgi:hypothetical protein